MRPGSAAALSVVAAVLGGLAVLLVGKATGWVSTDERTKTVVVQETQVAQAASAPAQVATGAKPLTGNGFEPRKIYARRSSGVVTIFAIYGEDAITGQSAQGSGFVVSPKGYILTNSHVITNAGERPSGTRLKAADKLYVEFEDHDRVPARIVGWDVFDDVGVIKVDPAEHTLNPVPLGTSATVAVGQPVAAIGSPFGNENSLTVGVVSATRRSIRSLTSQFDIVDAIQIDAPINHGNSGGPLFDARGRVIGINAQIRSDSGASEGVGFAVPVDLAKRSMTQLIAAGHVSYAYVGIETENLTPSLARRFGYPVRSGAVITNVKRGTPASAAGLRGGDEETHALGVRFTRGGDVIVAINGRPVRSSDDVLRIVAERFAPGQTARFTIVRNGRRQQIVVRLAERPASSG